MRLIKLLVVLVLAALIALVGYAYLGDMDPNQREVRDPIPVEGGTLAPAEAPAADADEVAPEAEAEPITEEDTTEAPGD